MQSPRDPVVLGDGPLPPPPTHRSVIHHCSLGSQRPAGVWACFAAPHRPKPLLSRPAGLGQGVPAAAAHRGVPRLASSTPTHMHTGRRLPRQADGEDGDGDSLERRSPGPRRSQRPEEKQSGVGGLSPVLSFQTLCQQQGTDPREPQGVKCFKREGVGGRPPRPPGAPRGPFSPSVGGGCGGEAGKARPRGRERLGDLLLDQSTGERH